MPKTNRMNLPMKSMKHELRQPSPRFYRPASLMRVRGADLRTEFRDVNVPPVATSGDVYGAEYLVNYYGVFRRVFRRYEEGNGRDVEMKSSIK